ncbi:MAG: CDP-alcohol phosphatidyltransferase family protein [Gammaproteobacteria bacterium]
MKSYLIFIPNFLSLIRIGMVYPILLWIANENYFNALTLFLIASLSDALDGYLARKFNWHTALGKLLDPIADKALLIGTIIILWVSGHIPLVVVILFLLRDILILLGAAFQMTVYDASTPSPNFLGKITTISQIVYLILIFSQILFLEANLPGFIHYLISSITALSLIVYAKEWIVITISLHNAKT